MRQSKPRGRLAAGRILRFGLPMAILVIMGAHTPWIAHLVPRFTFQAVAAAGAALIVFSFVTSLVQSIRRRRVYGQLSFLTVVVQFVDLLYLVIISTAYNVYAYTICR